MVVQEIMSVNPFTVDASQTVREAVQQLLTQDIRHLPVLDDGLLVGMLSDRDVRSLAAGALTGEAPDQLSAPVSEIMSSDPISVGPEAEIGEIIDLMVEHRVGALPVVAEDRLVGIVSYVDVLRYAKSVLDE
jgi:acetoin utilization protein AcuB